MKIELWLGVRSLLLILLSRGAFAQCERPVQRPGYSVCVPNGWRIDFEQNPESRRTIICKPNAGRCLKNKDIHPYAGVLLVDINVAEGRSRNDWRAPEDIIARARRLGEPVPQVSEVILKGSETVRRSCWLARALEYGDLWDETYGLTINGRRFMIHVFYNNEPANIDLFRQTVFDILSSLALTGQQR